MSCSSQTADTACPSSRTFLKIATLSAALCCRYRRARLLPLCPSFFVPDDYIPAGLGTPLSAEAGQITPFLPIWYSLGTLMPVDLGQAKNWRPIGVGIARWVAVQGVLGWVLVPLLIAQIAGLLKKRG